MSVNVSVVVVNWNVRDLLRQCLQSLISAPSARRDELGRLCIGASTVEIFVVDNASSDGSVEMIHSFFPEVQLLVSERNLGFTAGNNLALRQCTGRYVLLLNPDARLVGDAFAEMLVYMEGQPQVGVLGPRLLYPDGTAQSSRRRFPTLMTALMESTLLHEWFPGNRWARAYHLCDRPDDGVQDVDWLTGACLLVRGEILQQVGLLDERFFMYSEELDWCRRIKAYGWRIVYFPRAQAIHHEGQSSGQVVAMRQINFESSKVLYFRKHHGPLSAESLRAFLLVTHAFRLVEETAKYLVGHKRGMRRPRIRAHWQVLRSGLSIPGAGRAG